MPAGKRAWGPTKRPCIARVRRPGPETSLGKPRAIELFRSCQCWSGNEVRSPAVTDPVRCQCLMTQKKPSIRVKQTYDHNAVQGKTSAGAARNRGTSAVSDDATRFISGSAPSPIGEAQAIARSVSAVSRYWRSSSQPVEVKCHIKDKDDPLEAPV